MAYIPLQVQHVVYIQRGDHAHSLFLPAPEVVNPRRACAARVTVVGSVCLCVCVSVKSHLTYGASVRPENAVTYSAGSEGQKFVGICLKRLRSRVMPRNMSEKANMLIIPTYRCQLSPLGTQRKARGYPTIVNNIQPCPKLYLLMPLARVGARTDSTTSYSYNARRGQLPRTRIGIVRRTRARHAVCAEGLHFSAFHCPMTGVHTLL